MPHSNKNLDRWVTRKKSGIPSAGSRANAQVPAVKRKPILGQGYQQRLILSARTVKGRPMVGLPAVYGRWGREKIGSDWLLDKEKYRMPQIQHRQNFGGTGLDEMVSTASVAKIIQQMNNNGRSLEDIENVAELLSKEREEVRYLLWKTDDSSRPLSGHPGSLSKAQDDMSQGVTARHRTKDIIRAKWVLSQYNSGTGTEEERLADTSIMANIMTNQLFSEPFAQLDTISPTTATLLAYHPVHGPIYEDINGSRVKSAAFRKAAINTHNARERRKWATAEQLMRRGYNNLVHPDMYKWIAQEGGWEAGLHSYMQSVNGEQDTDTGATSSTAYVPQKTDGQLTMKQWNTAVHNGTMQPAIGKPRPLMRLATPYVSSGQRRYKQKQLTHYFKKRHK